MAFRPFTSDRYDTHASRRTALRVSAFALAGFLVPAVGAWATPATEPIPEIATLTDKELPLLASGAPGRATYLDFWASWCTPCRLSFPWMNEMHAKWAPRGLRIVGINLDRREADARRFLQSAPAHFELLMDPAAVLARLFDIKAMPSSVLLTADRRVVMRHRGFSLEDRPALERQISGQLAKA
jgi:thiol-disulfide isomerase/thioredoxin